jgi:small subunit ribosomal protein S6e
MPFKLNIGEKSGKTWKLELTSEFLIGKNVGDIIHGKEISADLEGYELKIAGASDVAGFPHKASVEGPVLRRVLLTRGWGMWDNTEGMRRRKTVRGKQLSEKTMQINLEVTKHGHKKLAEIFPEQNQPKVKVKKEVPVVA